MAFVEIASSQLTFSLLPIQTGLVKRPFLWVYNQQEVICLRKSAWKYHIIMLRVLGKIKNSRRVIKVLKYNSVISTIHFLYIFQIYFWILLNCVRLKTSVMYGIILLIKVIF